MFSTYHLIAYGLFAAFVLLELLSRGGARAFPAMPLWKLRGLGFAALYFAISTYSPLLWDGLLGQHTLLAADQYPLWAQIVGGFFALQLAVYVWHRTMHNVDFLWRTFHQMHHSAERIDIWSAFYFSPLDMVGWSVITSLALVGGFGISGAAGFFIGIIAAFTALLQHANVKTPQWLGYIIVRPESHSAHHERGVHARNYCDLPLIDMIFGTFHNPKTFEGEVGFYDGASARVGDMLLGKKIA